MANLKKYAKLVAAVLGAAVQAGVLTLLPEQWQPYATIAVAVLTAVGVYAVPNAQPGEFPAAPQDGPTLGASQLPDGQASA